MAFFISSALQYYFSISEWYIGRILVKLHTLENWSHCSTQHVQPDLTTAASQDCSSKGKSSFCISSSFFLSADVSIMISVGQRIHWHQIFCSFTHWLSIPTWKINLIFFLLSLNIFPRTCNNNNNKKNISRDFLVCMKQERSHSQNPYFSSRRGVVQLMMILWQWRLLIFKVEIPESKC